MIHYRHDIERARAPFNLGLFRRMFAYTMARPRRVAYAGALALVITVASMIQPIVVGVAIDQGIAAGDVTLLAAMSITYLVLSLTASGAAGMMVWVTGNIGQGMMFDIRMELFRKIQRLNLGFFDRTNSGSILSRFLGDVYTLNEVMTEGLVWTVVDLVMIVGIFIIMLTLSWQLALISFAVMPLLALFAGIFRVHAARAYRWVRALLSETNANLSESILGIRTTQTFTRERENERLFNEVTQRTLNAHRRARLIGVSIIPVTDLLAAVAIAAVLLYGGSLVLGDAGLQLGVVVTFLLYVQRLFGPIQEIGVRYDLLQSAMASAERIFGIIETPEQVQDDPAAGSMPPIEGRIEFDHVEFEYLPDQPVLRDVSFAIEPGQTYALVGATGAGKTTIINLLYRFYDINAGSVLVDGRDVRSVTQKSLRSQMGLVLQDPFLFQGSIHQNIAYGRPDASRAEVEAVAQAVNLHESIVGMDYGYDTFVSERGLQLSVGQRQLLSFARALLIDPKILVLDEATSSVDTRTEALVQSALAKLLEGRTSIVIAHRLSTIQKADQILVIDAGRIIERGTHDELLALGGHYRQMYEIGFDISDADMTEALARTS
ncbi:MAG: ABC transporter ATP-binding protein [Chloroflexota bacterium]|nr:ABC transporter ATP-binding protein [Chloroflexota bacterium]